MYSVFALAPFYKHTPLHVFRIGAAVVPVTWFPERAEPFLMQSNCFLNDRQ